MKSVKELQRMLDENQVLINTYTDRLKESEEGHKRAYDERDRDGMEFYAQDIGEVKAQLSLLQDTDTRLRVKIKNAMKAED